MQHWWFQCFYISKILCVFDGACLFTRSRFGCAPLTKILPFPVVVSGCSCLVLSRRRVGVFPRHRYRTFTWRQPQCVHWCSLTDGILVRERSRYFVRVVCTCVWLHVRVSCSIVCIEACCFALLLAVQTVALCSRRLRLCVTCGWLVTAKCRLGSPQASLCCDFRHNAPVPRGGGGEGIVLAPLVLLRWPTNTRQGLTRSDRNCCGILDLLTLPSLFPSINQSLSCPRDLVTAAHVKLIAHRISSLISDLIVPRRCGSVFARKGRILGCTALGLSRG